MDLCHRQPERYPFSPAWRISLLAGLGDPPFPGWGGHSSPPFPALPGVGAIGSPEEPLFPPFPPFPRSVPGVGAIGSSWVPFSLSPFFPSLFPVPGIRAIGSPGDPLVFPFSLSPLCPCAGAGSALCGPGRGGSCGSSATCCPFPALLRPPPCPPHAGVSHPTVQITGMIYFLFISFSFLIFFSFSVRGQPDPSACPAKLLLAARVTNIYVTFSSRAVLKILTFSTLVKKDKTNKRESLVRF